METVIIDKKEYKVPKAVQEHLNWLEIQLKVTKTHLNDMEDYLDKSREEFDNSQAMIYGSINSLRNLID